MSKRTNIYFLLWYLWVGCGDSSLGSAPDSGLLYLFFIPELRLKGQWLLRGASLIMEGWGSRGEYGDTGPFRAFAYSCCTVGLAHIPRVMSGEVYSHTEPWQGWDGQKNFEQVVQSVSCCGHGRLSSTYYV